MGPLAVVSQNIFILSRASHFLTYCLSQGIAASTWIAQQRGTIKHACTPLGRSRLQAQLYQSQHHYQIQSLVIRNFAWFANIGAKYDMRSPRQGEGLVPLFLLSRTSPAGSKTGTSALVWVLKRDIRVVLLLKVCITYWNTMEQEVRLLAQDGIWSQNVSQLSDCFFYNVNH